MAPWWLDSPGQRYSGQYYSPSPREMCRQCWCRSDWGILWALVVKAKNAQDSPTHQRIKPRKVPKALSHWHSPRGCVRGCSSTLPLPWASRFSSVLLVLDRRHPSCRVETVHAKPTGPFALHPAVGSCYHVPAPSAIRSWRQRAGGKLS